MSSIGVMHHYHRLSSFGNCPPVFRRPHITTAWSPPWQYCANSSACSVISSKHAFMYTFFMPKHLWRSQNKAWYWEWKDCHTIFCTRLAQNKDVKGSSKSSSWLCLTYFVLVQLMLENCIHIDKIFDLCAKNFCMTIWISITGII